MSLSKDIDSPQHLKKPGPAMSYRQQIKYALERSIEENTNLSVPITDAQLHELEEYIQDEDRRVIFT